MAKMEIQLGFYEFSFVEKELQLLKEVLRVSVVYEKGMNFAISHGQITEQLCELGKMCYDCVLTCRDWDKIGFL